MLRFLKSGIVIYFLVSVCILPCRAQQEPDYSLHVSIHQEQSGYYQLFKNATSTQFDSINRYTEIDGSGNVVSPIHDDNSIHRNERLIPSKDKRGANFLNKRVFGYHPYWSGTKWHQYHWDQLTDLCYFSYDVDPATGNAASLYDFMTDPVIDTALKHNVNVHLCVTLFSGHAQFFQNSIAQQTLILNLIALVENRGLKGINIDFEALPSAYGQNFTSFIQSLSTQLHSNYPAAELSIASPAINWNNTFNLQDLNPWTDLFMVMTYDYYWSGSTLAGPIGGLWPLTSSFNYSTSHSITYYENQGIRLEKILMGVAYYGRDWPVNGNYFPASTTGPPATLTYAQIVSGSNNNYIPSNLEWDYRSYNPYYNYNTGTWRQCFFDNTRSLGYKYDFVNRRSLAGIGIWALGYDNGRDELWDLIDYKFKENNSESCTDTLYDTGGPVWNYKVDQSYTETVRSSEPGPLSLEFPVLSLEAGYDSLWIYDGDTLTAPLLVALSGNEVPVKSSSDLNKLPILLSTTSNVFTIRFKSDGQNNGSGYEIIWNCPTASVYNEKYVKDSPIVYPNPVSGGDNVYVSVSNARPVYWQLFDLNGRITGDGDITSGYFKLPFILKGFYILRIITSKGSVDHKMIIN